MFEVIPAIDLQGGRCVRLVQGDFDRSTVYGDDPPAMARHWEALGAQRIHVVDLDGAREGGPRQLDAVSAIVGAVEAPVQVGGGMRSSEHVAAAFRAGVSRVILGTAALEDEAFLRSALDQHGKRIAVGIDARDGRVAVRGWLEVSDLDALCFAEKLADLGVRTIVYTDIGRDGMLTGPNMAAMERMVAAVPSVDVIASGGVGTVEDIVRLSQTGAVGVIVGKALYDGAVDLASAFVEVAKADIRAAHTRTA